MAHRKISLVRDIHCCPKLFSVLLFHQRLHTVKNIYIYKGKGTAVPLRAWIGPEGSRKLRFPDIMTTAQDGGKVVSLTHRPPLPPENTPGIHFC